MKRWVALLLAGAALIVAVAGSDAYAQATEEPDVITLDGDDSPDTSETSANAADQKGTTLLKRLVIGADTSNADITNKPAAVSTISAEEFHERFAGDVSNAVRSTPGAFTRQQTEQPGIIVNVRGMQGMGRVATMIDGVPQTFSNLSGHGGSFDNMAFVDPNMLVGVDIERGAVAGNDGLGTLSGAANFRTIGIDDVLLPDKTYGGLSTVQLGTNGKYFSRLTAAGWKHPLDNEGAVSIMGAVSGSNFGNFRNGDGIEYPYDTSQQPSSGLFKFDFAPDSEHSLQLGGIWYDNAFAVESAGYDWQISNKTYTAKYAYQPGDNIVDLRVNAYANITDIAMQGAEGEFDGRDGTNTGLGFDISNTSVLEMTDETSIKFNYGGAIASDKFVGNDARGANPDGQLIKSGAFLDAALTHGIFGVNAGLRYDAWNLSGITEYIEPGEDGCPAGHDGLCDGAELSRHGGEWNPKLGATITPRDWLQLYANYAYTMRPPTASEMFYPGGHNFDGTGDPINNNPNLLPERQKGLDIGINLRADGLLSPEDTAYAKVGYFYNRISDYITYATDSDGETRWVNLPGETVMQGVELEGGYDMGLAYGKFSLTVANTEQPMGEGAGFGRDVGTLPDDFATLDLGMRFFEQRLTLGGRVRYTGDSVQVLLDKEQSMERPAYTLVDLYGSWKINQNFRAFVSVENLFNESYWTANSGSADLFSGITNGHGRTFVFGATARF